MIEERLSSQLDKLACWASVWASSCDVV